MMTIDSCNAVLRIWGMTHFRTLDSGASLWMDRDGNPHRVPNLAPLSLEERRDLMQQMAERIGEVLPAEAAA